MIVAAVVLCFAPAPFFREEPAPSAVGVWRNEKREAVLVIRPDRTYSEYTPRSEETGRWRTDRGGSFSAGPVANVSYAFRVHGDRLEGWGERYWRVR